jgi:Na+/H+ antiporter NhaC
MPHPYGWLSLLPPVVAIVLAIVTRRVVVSLLAGIFVGALILNHGNPFAAVGEALETHLWETAIDEGNLRLFAFTLLMGGMVGVLSASGGMQGLIRLVTPWASSRRDRRRGQLTTWAAGMLIFFDDYANTILLGNTLRPLCDRLRISREKLSFIVDSTAAPVAGIAPLATWVAIEIDLIGEGLSSVAAAADQSVPGAFELFLYSIPYRFYPIWMLVFVALVAVLLRDFGPMRRAERMTIDDEPSPGRLAVDIDADELRVPARWFNAVVPIVVTLAVVVVLLYTTGRANLREKQAAMIAQDAQDTPAQSASPSAGETPARLRDILGEADSSFALAYASLAGLVLAVAMVRVQRILSWDQIGRACDRGIRAMLPALVILICAMTLSGMTKGNPAEDGDRPFEQQDVKLYAAYYLSGLLLGEGADGDAASAEPLHRGLSARRELLTWSLPTVVFVLAAVISFCTGTSFGTMGILMPMTVPLAFDVLGGVGSVSADNPILLGTIGGVLAGSIFGDHCSPISDTTVLSSQASACDHLAHVWTQMPYALTVGGVAILFGTLPLGLGAPVWLLLPVGVAVLVGVLLVFGTRD